VLEGGNVYERAFGQMDASGLLLSSIAPSIQGDSVRLQVGLQHVAHECRLYLACSQGSSGPSECFYRVRRGCKSVGSVLSVFHNVGASFPMPKTLEFRECVGTTVTNPSSGLGMLRGPPATSGSQPIGAPLLNVSCASRSDMSCNTPHVGQDTSTPVPCKGIVQSYRSASLEGARGNCRGGLVHRDAADVDSVGWKVCGKSMQGWSSRSEGGRVWHGPSVRSLSARDNDRICRRG